MLKGIIGRVKEVAGKEVLDLPLLFWIVPAAGLLMLLVLLIALCRSG